MTLSNEHIALANVVAARIDARLAKASDASVANLEKARKTCTDVDAVKLFLATDFDLNFLDSNVHMLNHKLHNVVKFVNNRDTLNHYTRTIFLTARNLNANNMQLNTLDVKCIADADFKIKNGDARHACYVIDKEACKASFSTQTSSSIQLLLALNILKRDGKHAFKFNADAVATHLFEVALQLI